VKQAEGLNKLPKSLLIEMLEASCRQQVSLNGYAIGTAGGTNGDYERMMARERMGRKRKQEYLRGCPAQLGSG
jgi:hypothetical protein